MAFTHKRVVAFSMCAAVVVLAACATPTPTALTPTPVTEPVVSPTPSVTATPKPYDPSSLLPTTNTDPLPEGAVSRLGIGYVSTDVSPDRRYFLLGTAAGYTLYDFNSLTELWDQARPQGKVTWLTDKQSVRIGRYVYDIATGQQMREADPSVKDLDWSPDGQVAAREIEGATVALVDVNTGEVVRYLTPPDSLAPLPNDVPNYNYVSFVFSPDGTHIAATYTWSQADIYRCGDIMSVWATATGELVNNFSPVDCIRLLEWSPNGKYISTGGSSNMKVVWDVDAGTEALRLPPDRYLFWSADGRIAAIYSSNQVDVIDAITLARKSTPTDRNFALGIFPDGSALMVRDDHSISILDASTGDLLGIIPPEPYLDITGSANKMNVITYDFDGGASTLLGWTLRDTSQPALSFLGVPGSFLDLVWSPDSSQLVVNNNYHNDKDHYSTLWDVASSTAVKAGKDADPNHIDWFEYSTGQARQCDVERGYCGLVTVTSHNGNVKAIADTIRADEGSKSGHVDFINSSTNKPVRESLQLDAVPLSFAWSPDDTKLAIGFNDKTTIEIWDVTDFDHPALLATYQSGITDESSDSGFVQVAWSPDSELIAGIYSVAPFGPDGMGCPCTGQRQIVFWNAVTGERIEHPATLAEGGVLAFSPNGQYIAVGNLDGVVTIWETHPK